MAVTLQDKLAKLGPERRGRVDRRGGACKEVVGLRKVWPVLRTDEEAERFVAEADLTGYDFSAMVPVHFELRRKGKSVSLRLPQALLGAVKRAAPRRGIPYQRFMRHAIERAMVTEKMDAADGRGSCLLRLDAARQGLTEAGVPDILRYPRNPAKS